MLLTWIVRLPLSGNIENILNCLHNILLLRMLVRVCGSQREIKSYPLSSAVAASGQRDLCVIYVEIYEAKREFI